MGLLALSLALYLSIYLRMHHHAWWGEKAEVSRLSLCVVITLPSQGQFEMVQMRLQKAKANTIKMCWSWYYHSSPSSCIPLLCSLDQSVSPATPLSAQSILDSAYINTQCLTNRLRSFNWITRRAAFPLVRLGVVRALSPLFPSTMWVKDLIRCCP